MTTVTEWTDEMLSDLQRQFLGGVSTQAIAAGLGLNRSTIAGKLQRLGVTRKGNPAALPAMLPDTDHQLAAPRPPHPPPKPLPSLPRLPPLPTGGPCLWPTWTMKDDAYWGLITAGIAPRCGKPAAVRVVEAGALACPYCEEHAAIAFAGRPPFARLRAA